MPLEAYIVDCCRTPAGKKNGWLSKWHPADLGAEVVNALIDRTGIPPEAVDDCIFGCVSQIGSQAGNVGRNIVLSSKLPLTVPGTTVDRQCGSSQQALHFAAQAVMSGTQDVVIAGGVEVMSLVPIGSNILDGMRMKRGNPQGPKIMEKYKVQFSQFLGAELLAKKYDLTRQEMDSFAVASHAKAMKATQNGYFDNEIIPVKGWDKKTNEELSVTKDQGIRPGTTMEKVSKLKTLKKDGVITAALASQISDGASAVMIVNERALRKYGLKPRAKIVSLGLAGSDPVVMLEGPIPATRQALDKANLTLEQCDCYEVNEAFCSVPLAWAKALDADLDKLNMNGGAMALGHPLGATGTKLMCTLVNTLERIGGRYAVQAICEGGGTANATIIERCRPLAKL